MFRPTVLPASAPTMISISATEMPTQIEISDAASASPSHSAETSQTLSTTHSSPCRHGTRGGGMKKAASRWLGHIQVPPPTTCGRSHQPVRRFRGTPSPSTHVLQIFFSPSTVPATPLERTPGGRHAPCRQLRDGRYRLTLWHHVQPCPDDEERYDLILERPSPSSCCRRPSAAKDKPVLIELCVETTLRAYGLVAQKKADLPLWGTYVETEPEKYRREESASLWMRLCGRPLQVWSLTAPRCRRKQAPGWLTGRGGRTQLRKTSRSQNEQAGEATFSQFPTESRGRSESDAIAAAAVFAQRLG